jgi:hypothetical protein
MGWCVAAVARIICGFMFTFILGLFVYFFFFLLFLLLALFLVGGLYRKVEGIFLQNGGIHQQDYMVSQREDNDLNSHCHEKFKT